MPLQPLSRAYLRLRDRDRPGLRERHDRREPLLLRPELRLRRALRLPAELRLLRLKRNSRSPAPLPCEGGGDGSSLGV